MTRLDSNYKGIFAKGRTYFVHSGGGASTAEGTTKRCQPQFWTGGRSRTRPIAILLSVLVSRKRSSRGKVTHQDLPARSPTPMIHAHAHSVAPRPANRLPVTLANVPSSPTATAWATKKTHAPQRSRKLSGICSSGEASPWRALHIP